MNDLIDRRAAIDAVKNTDVVVLYHDTEPVEEAIEEAIEATKRSITTGIEGLPSVQPKPIVAKRKSTVEILSDLRCQYSCFDEDEEPVYRALSEAIKAVEQPEPHREDGGK